MPTLQNLVLLDRAATPVSHTFTPLDSSNGVGKVAESSGIPIGNNTVQVSMKKQPSGNYKGIVKYTFPIVQTQTVNGVSTPVVVRTTYINLEVTFAPTSTTQERKDAIGMLQSSLDPAKLLINDALIGLQGIFS